jgi:hypothetical protein
MDLGQRALSPSDLKKSGFIYIPIYIQMALSPNIAD